MIKKRKFELVGVEALVMTTLVERTGGFGTVEFVADYGVAD